MYPWNFAEILKSKKRLLSQAREAETDAPLIIQLVGGYTTHDLADWLKIFNFKSGLKCNVILSEWGGTQRLCLSPNQIKEATSLYILMANWQDLFSREIFDQSIINEDELVAILIGFWEKAAAKGQNIIQCLYSHPHRFSMFNSNATDVYQLTNGINAKLISASQAFSNVLINHTDIASSIYGSLQWYDDRNWHAYGQPLSLEGTLALSHQLSVAVRSLYGQPKKLLILDLDNTLWGDIIGDDGADNINIGPDTSLGRPFYDFQVYIKSLQKKGVLLAICSKNEEKIALSGFDHTGMHLKPSDFAAMKINWNNKSENIVEICKELNLGLSSIVFIDDNPAERDEVRMSLPDVSVPEIGNDPSEYVKILDLNQFFIHHDGLTVEDKKRNDLYADNKKRLNDEALFIDHESFIKSLETIIWIEKFIPANIDRVHQLFNKTNQFNLNTIRLSKKDLELISISDKNITMTARASDKYGDHGLISALYGTINNKSLAIDNWVMSCRVFDRTIEFALFDALVNICLSLKIDTVIGTHTPTNTNYVISDLYMKLGFEKIGEESTLPNETTEWSISIDQKTSLNNHHCEIKYEY